MQRVVRFTSRRPALKAGVMLHERYYPDPLTGLHFFIEQTGSVIMAALFEGDKRPPPRNRLDVILFPGEDLQAKVEDLIGQKRRWMHQFIDDGLEEFEGYCMAWGVKR